LRVTPVRRQSIINPPSLFVVAIVTRGLAHVKTTLHVPQTGRPGLLILQADTLATKQILRDFRHVKLSRTLSARLRTFVEALAATAVFGAPFTRTIALTPLANGETASLAYRHKLPLFLLIILVLTPPPLLPAPATHHSVSFLPDFPAGPTIPSQCNQSGASPTQSAKSGASSVSFSALAIVLASLALLQITLC